jgi:transcriptional regulator with XRE-family HTH domain
LGYLTSEVFNMGGHTRGDGTGFGAKLKELRERAGLSQAQLAEKAAMNVFGVAKLEQGQRDPSWASVLALAAALGVDCSAFAECEDVKGEPEAKSAPLAAFITPTAKAKPAPKKKGKK